MTILIFQMCQCIPVVGHIFCLLQLNICFFVSNNGLEYMSVCATEESTCIAGALKG